MRMLFLLAVIVASTAVPVLAVEQCSIHPAKGMSDAQLAGLAKLSQVEAEKIAVARLKSSETVSTTSAELEAEHGCLIWSFDLRVPSKSGVEEMQIDAGDGKVLSVKHESARHEATEMRNEAKLTPKK
jgi:hypothetical protein